MATRSTGASRAWPATSVLRLYDVATTRGAELVRLSSRRSSPTDAPVRELRGASDRLPLLVALLGLFVLTGRLTAADHRLAAPRAAHTARGH